MKRVFAFVGLIGAAAYLFGSPLPAPRDQVELALSPPSVGGPLRTSWGFTLESLRQQPAAPQHIASPRSKPPKTEPDRLLMVGEPDRDLLEWARATLAAYRERSTPSAPDAASPEMWVIGQTNGWVHRDESATDARGLPSYDYVAALEDLHFGQDTAEAEEPPSSKPASPKTRQAVHVAAVAEPESPTPTAKPAADTTDDIKVAGPYRPGGLFARRAHSDDAPRGGGLFGLFGARKTERPGWSVGPAG